MSDTVQMKEPVDDPFCGECGQQCGIKWQYEDYGSGCGTTWEYSQLCAEGVSDCCEAEMFCDEEKKFPYEPDPNEHGAFDPPDYD